jgi:hypothetical protein
MLPGVSRKLDDAVTTCYRCQRHYALDQVEADHRCCERWHSELDRLVMLASTFGLSSRCVELSVVNVPGMEPRLLFREEHWQNKAHSSGV